MSRSLLPSTSSDKCDKGTLAAHFATTDPMLKFESRREDLGHVTSQFDVKKPRRESLVEEIIYKLLRPRAPCAHHTVQRLIPCRCHKVRQDHFKKQALFGVEPYQESNSLVNHSSIPTRSDTDHFRTSTSACSSSQMLSSSQSSPVFYDFELLSIT